MSHHDYDAEYAGDRPPPWEIGKPQPALAALIDRIVIKSPVIDVGCGTGELALAVAEQGHDVVGIDASEPGIAKARAKAATRGLEIRFEVADATRLEDLEVRPATVLDSGLLHSLDADGQRAYVAGLAVICEPGAAVAVLGASADGGMGWGLTRDGLAETFAEPDWTETVIEDADIVASSDGEELILPSFLLTTRRALA